MSLLSLAASALSGLLAAASWVGHHIQTISVSPQTWPCLACGVANELERDACWSCGDGYGQDPLYPSPIPFERRWICSACTVWNGITRTDCWRCGAIRDPTTTSRDGGTSAASARLAPASRRRDS